MKPARIVISGSTMELRAGREGKGHLLHELHLEQEDISSVLDSIYDIALQKGYEIIAPARYKRDLR